MSNCGIAFPIKKMSDFLEMLINKISTFLNHLGDLYGLERLEMVNLNPGVVLLDFSTIFSRVSLGHDSTVFVGCISERAPLSLHELA